MPFSSTKHNIYIRKLNGLGQKITVQDSLTIKDLKNLVRSLPSLQNNIKDKQFNLIFKGKNITEKSQSTLKQLNIPVDGIVHIVFLSQQQIQNTKMQAPPHFHYNNLALDELDSNTRIQNNKFPQFNVRIIFDGREHSFSVHPFFTVQDLKKKIAIKLNLVYESLILSHLGIEMLNQKLLKQFPLGNETLLSLKFNLQKPQKKKLESRMVSSVTFSDQNNQPNYNNNTSGQNKIFDNKVMTTSSKSIDSDKQQKSDAKKPQNYLGTKNMYKSDINSLGGVSKAALMFTNALHQKIVETQSVVSGQFSQDASGDLDSDSVMVLVHNEDETREYLLQCHKTHEIVHITQIIMTLQRLETQQKVEISLQQDLFESIDLSKSGCVTLYQMVKKIGKQKVAFIYRLIK